jgi:hypothetical protein
VEVLGASWSKNAPMWTESANEDTVAKVRSVEDQSESAVASKFGMTLADFRERMAAILGFDSIDALLENRSKEVSGGQALAAELIERAYQQGRLNSLQLNTARLSEELSACSNIRRDSSIATILNSIPSVFIFEQHFNATASMGSKKLPFPHMRFYRLMPHVVQLACLCIANNALEHGPSGTLKLRPFEDALPTSLDHPIFTSLINILLLVDRPNIATWESTLFPSLPHDSTNSFGHALFGGAMMAIWLHELGHILLGHLDGPTDDIENQELEADEFARLCLLSVWDPSEIYLSALTNKLPLLTGAYILALLTSALRPGVVESKHNKLRAEALKELIEDELDELADVVSYLVTPLVALRDLAYREDASIEYRELIIRLNRKGYLS